MHQPESHGSHKRRSYSQQAYRLNSQQQDNSRTYPDKPVKNHQFTLIMSLTLIVVLMVAILT